MSKRNWRNELWPGTVIGKDGRPASKGFCAIHNCASVARFDDGSWRCLLCQAHADQYKQVGFVRQPYHRDYQAWAEGRFMEVQPV